MNKSKVKIKTKKSSEDEPTLGAVIDYTHSHNAFSRHVFAAWCRFSNRHNVLPWWQTIDLGKGGAYISNATKDAFES